jgi:hypothetical protein
MTNRIVDISHRKAAIIAGFGLLAMGILAAFANFFVLQRLVVSGDAAATANNIIASEGLFRAGICSFLIVAILDVVVAWALYVLLKPTNKNLSLLTAWFRLVYAAILGIALVNLLSVLQLLSGADYLTAFEPNQLRALVMFFLDVHEQGVFIATVFWGLWLFPLGYLVFKSGYFPRILGVLLIIACFGNMLELVTFFLIPNFDNTISLYTGYGEILFMLWLLIKGVNVEQWEKRALESA